MKYDDTAVLPQTLYVYRVFAVGVAGRSLPSNEVAVVSPSPAPVTDTTAPRVTIVTPPRNARVSGVVRVVASASDNVGVVRMNISTTSGTVLRAVDGASLTYDWNTSSLRRGSTQTLIVPACLLSARCARRRWPCPRCWRHPRAGKATPGHRPPAWQVRRHHGRGVWA